jgi:oxygen-dependent protoporphyrinogen oxidase
MSQPSLVAIVGGGISGLATAFYLLRAAQANGVALRCAVYEGDARLGGKIITERVDGVLVEGGPESFVTRKPAALALCRELGLGDRLLGADDAGRNYVLHDSQLVRVPTSPQGFVATPLLSLKGKLRAAQELALPAKQTGTDESLGGFVRRRFGDEVLERLVAPAVGSIYLSDVDQLSTRVSFDRFLQLEKQHGSVLKGMLAMQRAMRRQAAHAQRPPKPKPPPFVTLPGGLAELVDALVNRLGEMGCHAHTNMRANQLAQTHHGRYDLTFAAGATRQADIVVLAVPAFAMADLLAPHTQEAATLLRSVRYINVATITLAYPRSAMGKPFDGFGVVVPERESSPLMACEVMSNKWPGRGAPDRVVLRAFVGGHRNEAIVAQPDDALVELAHRELARIFAIDEKPSLSRVYRWQPGNPQHPVGYLEDLAQVEATLKDQLPNVFLAGAGMRGLGIPDCVRQAQETAAQVLTSLAGASSPMAVAPERVPA